MDNIQEKKIISDLHTDEISGMVKSVFDLDQRYQELNNTFATYLPKLNDTVSEISEGLTKNNKHFLNLENDISVLKTEVLKANFRLDALESEITHFRKDHNSKTEIMIGKLSQMVDLLTKISSK